MSDIGCRNLNWSLALLDGLVQGGLRRLVLSPGSRSTPLVLAAQRQPGIQLTAVLDERSAAFYALGIARGCTAPVGLICTSGSAAAHWYPAVIEASAWGVPLVLLSADRPPELRAWGANQTVDQTRLFGSFVREFHDPGAAASSTAALKAMRALGRRAAAVALGPRPGPVHINLPFREPLVPEGPCEANPMAAPTEQTEDAWTRVRPRGPVTVSGFAGRGLICCGPGDFSPAFAEALWCCAAALRLPVVVDPLSGLRFGPAPRHRIARYDTFLRNAPAAATLRPEWVLRFGRAPVSKTLNAWLEGVPMTVVDPAGCWIDPTHDARAWIDEPPEAVCAWLPQLASGACNAEWLASWSACEAAAERAVAEYVAHAPWCEAQVIPVLLDAMGANDALFCANSLPIRQLDSWSGTRSKPQRIFGNRGASGIDGNLSTLAGLNASGLPTWGILGDLALFHDLSGLLLGDRLTRPVLVIDNGGGRIFDYLPQAGLPRFEELWRTPVGVGLEGLARSFGIDYERVEDATALAAALAGGSGPPDGRLIEVRIDGDLSRRVHQDFWRRIGEASIL